MTSSTNSWEEEFVEAGADLEHKRWAGWYLHEKKTWSLENEVRWDRQAITDYKDLSEAEKESDRREVRTYLPLIRSLLATQREEVVEELWGKDEEYMAFRSGELASFWKRKKEEMVQKVRQLEKSKPTTPCINAENHLFGSCFSCKEVDGYNLALQDIIKIIKGE